MLGRIMGVVTLKAATYREIADDENATGQAVIIVIVMALYSGIVVAAALALLSSSLPPGTVGSPLGPGFRNIISTISVWLVGSWVFAFVSTRFYGGKASTGEMLRVFGFTQVFQVLVVFPLFGAIVRFALIVISAIIGVREAAEIDTAKAVLTGIVGFIVLYAVDAVTGAVIGGVGL